MNGGGRCRLRGDSLLFLDSCGLRLKAVQIVCGLLRMGCGTEDRPLVFLQNLQPALNVGRVIRASFGRQPRLIF